MPVDGLKLLEQAVYFPLTLNVVMYTTNRGHEAVSEVVFNVAISPEKSS